MNAKKLPTVLVVDDQSEAHWIVDMALRQFKVNAIHVDSASEAKGALKESIVDIVICDFHMEGETGIEVVRYLQTEGKNIPFIMFTAEQQTNIPHVSYLWFSLVEKSEVRKLQQEVLRYLASIH